SWSVSIVLAAILSGAGLVVSGSEWPTLTELANMPIVAAHSSRRPWKDRSLSRSHMAHMARSPGVIVKSRKETRSPRDLFQECGEACGSPHGVGKEVAGAPGNAVSCVTSRPQPAAMLSFRPESPVAMAERAADSVLRRSDGAADCAGRCANRIASSAGQTATWAARAAGGFALRAPVLSAGARAPAARS